MPKQPLALALATLLAGCAGQTPSPVSVPLQQAAAHRPVVLVPGITGTILRDAATGEVAWGTGRRLVTPHDGGYALAVPISSTPRPDPLATGAVLEEVRLLGIRKDVYGPVARTLEANGYQRGDLSAPRPGDSLFLFAYDWRQDNEAAVRRLAEELDGVRRARGVDRLEVDLICQSNGAHICRYLAKYGGLSFAEAEAGAARPATLDVRKVILVGTSNGGSLRILRELDRGRRYVMFGRRIRPETLFTFVSLFEDLPVYRDRYFLDPQGRVLDVDLWDPASWERYGWSIFGREARERLRRRPRPDLFGGLDDWRRALRRSLAQGRRLHQLLERDVDVGAARYYLVQNVSADTPDYAVLVDGGGAWKMLFTGDRALRRYPAAAAQAAARGDGHASRESQMWLSPRETAAIARDPFHVEGKHFELILEPASLEELLADLAD